MTAPMIAVLALGGAGFVFACIAIALSRPWDSRRDLHLTICEMLSIAWCWGILCASAACFVAAFILIAIFGK